MYTFSFWCENKQNHGIILSTSSIAFLVCSQLPEIGTETLNPLDYEKFYIRPESVLVCLHQSWAYSRGVHAA